MSYDDKFRVNWTPSARPVKEQIRELIGASINPKSSLVVMPGAQGWDVRKLISLGKITTHAEWRIVEKDSNVLKSFQDGVGKSLMRATYFNDLTSAPTEGADFIYADLLGNLTPAISGWLSRIAPRDDLDLFITFSTLVRGNTFFKTITQSLKDERNFLASIISRISRNGMQLSPAHLQTVAAHWVLLQYCLPKSRVICYPYHDKANMFLYHIKNFTCERHQLPDQICKLVETALFSNYEILLEKIYTAQNEQDLRKAQVFLDEFISKRPINERKKLERRFKQDLQKLYKAKLKRIFSKKA